MTIQVEPTGRPQYGTATIDMKQSLRMAELALDAGVPEGVVNVVTGYGAEAGAALADHPDVDHLSFTGSRRTGEQVMVASARQMGPVMLELGGKSPSILLRDADLDAILPALRRAIVWNAGQTCDAQCRILVDHAIHGQLLDALAAAFDALSIGPGVEDRDVGPLVSPVQHERVSAHVDAARERDGARAGRVLRAADDDRAGGDMIEGIATIRYLTTASFGFGAPSLLLGRRWTQRTGSAS